MASAITWLVGCWLALGLVLQAWLVWRQSRFLARNRSEVPESFRGSVTSDEHARAADYGRARLWGSLFDESWSLALVFVWTLGGGLAILTGWLPMGLPGAIALLAVFSALQEFLRLPARLLQVAAVEARFGFNRAGPVLLLRDAVVRTAVAAVLGLMAGALLLPPVLILGPVGWLLAGLTAVAAAGLLLWAQPRVIAPLFNRFRPLEQGALRTRLETMIARCGARAESMFVMDGSRRSGQANAYFSGFGRAKRVVLFDTLIEDLDDNEIEAVLAHELGHDCEGHFRRHYALLGILLLCAVLVIGVAGSFAILAALGVPASAAAWLAAGFLLWPRLAWPLQPWLAARLRRYEFEADAFAARHADAHALVSALKRLLAHNAASLRVDPLYAAFHASHPPPEQRLAALESIGAQRVEM